MRFLSEQKQSLGAMTVAEKRVALLFALVVLAWMLRKPASSYLGLSNLSDAGIAMTAALLLFIIPSGMPKSRSLLAWEDVSKLPWGVLILFGGGLSLAAAVSQSGLAQWLGYAISPIGSIGIFALIIAATAMVIFLTELTSNLATAATFLPVVAAVALELDISPLILCIPVTLAASCAFMLPVATAPNAIVFSTGVMRIPDMAKAGVLLNLMGLVILSCIAIFLAPLVFA
jgi:sodium-dependent dicarboxylate transporter 2/3/5